VLTLKPKSQNLTSHNITRREIIDEEDVTTESSDEEEVLVTTELPEPTEVISQKVECIFLDCKKVLQLNFRLWLLKKFGLWRSLK